MPDPNRKFSWFPPIDNLLQLPVVLGQVKSFRANKVIGNPDLNARGLHRWRVEAAWRLAEKRRSRLRSQLDPSDAEALDRDGFVIKPDFLDPEIFRMVREAVYAKPLPAREMRQGQTVTRIFPLGGRALAPVRRLARRKELKALMSYAAGRSGTPHFLIQSVLADPTHPTEDPQTTLHSDTFHPTSKLWFFLHDVGPDEGPFVYVPGGHQPTAARLDWEYRQSLSARSDARQLHSLGSFRTTESELHDLGYQAPRKVAVKANTLVVANTYGFHCRSESAKPTTRVELYGSLRRNPFLPWNGLDPKALFGIWQVDAYFLGLGLMEKLFSKDRKWKSAGRIDVESPPLR